MNRILLLFLVLMPYVMILAQENALLEGIVKDESGLAVFSATVVADASKGLATTTDFDGKYQLSLPPGTYKISISFMGFENQEKEVVLKSGEKRQLEFILISAEHQLTEVDIVGPTRRGVSIEKEVVTVVPISKEMLNNNVITIGSEAVDKVPGVTLLDGQVSIRGGSGYAYGAGSRVILVIDEIPLLSPERNEILWDFIPMENLKSMDVVKGASSVQYGSAALNGIVSVTTNWPTEKKETKLTLWNTIYSKPPIKEGQWWNYSTDYVEAPHETGVMWSHGRKLNKNQDLMISGAFISSQTHIKTQYNNRIRNEVKWRISPEKVKGLTVTLNSNLLYRNNNQFFIWNNATDGAYDGRSFRDKYIRYAFDPVAKYFYKENNIFTLTNRIYYDQRLGARKYFGLLTYNDFQYKRKFINKEKAINGNLIVGFINNHNIIKASSFTSYSKKGNGIFNFNTASTYLQGDFGWKDLTLVAGGRFDYVALDGFKTASKPVFNAGASYEIGTQNYMRFGFGQSFRIPSVAERYVKEVITSLGPLNVYALPNPDIKPEEGYSFELGYKKIFKTPKVQFTADAALFYQRFKNMTEFTFGNYQSIEDTTVYDLGFKMLNYGNTRIFGWELGGDIVQKLDKGVLTYMVGYTYSYAANADEDSSLNKIGPVVRNAFKAFKIKKEEFVDYYDNNENNILFGMMKYRFRHTIKADINYEYKKWSLGTNIRYYGFMDRVDAVFATFIPGIKDYRDSQNWKGDWVIDMRVHYHFTDKISLGFICKNIANNNYQLRPAKPDAPRTYTLQLKMGF